MHTINTLYCVMCNRADRWIEKNGFRSKKRNNQKNFSTSTIHVQFATSAIVKKPKTRDNDLYEISTQNWWNGGETIAVNFFFIFYILQRVFQWLSSFYFSSFGFGSSYIFFFFSLHAHPSSIQENKIKSGKRVIRQWKINWDDCFSFITPVRTLQHFTDERLHSERKIKTKAVWIHAEWFFNISQRRLMLREWIKETETWKRYYTTD